MRCGASPVGELKLNVPPLLLRGEIDCRALPELDVWLWLNCGVVEGPVNPRFDGARFSGAANVLGAVSSFVRLSLVTFESSISSSLHLFAPGHLGSSFSNAKRQFSTSDMAISAALLCEACMTTRRMIRPDEKRYWVNIARWCDGGMTAPIEVARKMHDRLAAMAFGTDVVPIAEGILRLLGRKLRWSVIRTE
jgi:hypothetical protein